MDVEERGPITRLPKYIPPRKGKAKVPKDPDNAKFTDSTLLLPEKVPFEGALLGHIPALKMEDWDLVDNEKFLHLATNKYLAKIYYEGTGVMRLEPMKWVAGVEKVGLLNMLWVPHFSRTSINMMCIHQLLTLVHDECLRWETPSPSQIY